MKDDVKVMGRRSGLLPQTGWCATANKTFFLLHKLFVAFYLPVVIAFYDKPTRTMAEIDTYIDIIFFFEIVLTFFSPYTDDTMRVVTGRGSIACNYISGWFIIDLIACTPLSILHRIS